MNDIKNSSSLWEECKNAFSLANSERLEELLKNMIEIVRKYDKVLEAKAEIDFLQYIMHMEAEDYLIGTNGDKFEVRLKAYMQQENLSVEEIWRILSGLVWDLTIPVTDKICPFCRCDNLALMMNREKSRIYEYCETCFGTLEKGAEIMRPDNLYPASKDMLEERCQGGFWGI